MPAPDFGDDEDIADLLEDLSNAHVGLKLLRTPEFRCHSENSALDEEGRRVLDLLCELPVDLVDQIEKIATKQVDMGLSDLENLMEMAPEGSILHIDGAERLLKYVVT